MLEVTPHKPVSMSELRVMASARFGNVVKAVVDVQRGIMLLDADMHADQEAELLGGGWRQQDLWGINLYPDITGSDWIEFDSMIDLRPSSANTSRGVDDPEIRSRIARLLDDLVMRP